MAKTREVRKFDVFNPRFEDVPPYISFSGYAVDIPLGGVVRTLEEYREQGLDTDPDFQRGHVWNETQQSRFVEHVVRGGTTGIDIYMNNPRWSRVGRARAGEYADFVLVDGKQRLRAVERFFKNEIRAFGVLFSEFKDRPDMLTRLRFNVNQLGSRAEVLRWYLDLNAGGTVHADDEIEKVRALLAAERRGGG